MDDEPIIIKMIPEQKFVCEIIKSLNDMGHHIPLNVLASTKCDDNVWMENYKMHSFIKFQPFKCLVGKRLFGIQPINGCDSCVFPKTKEDDQNEHKVISKILEECIFVSFFSPNDEYAFFKSSIIELAQSYMDYKKEGKPKYMNYAINDFAANYKDPDKSMLKSIGLIGSNKAKSILEDSCFSDSNLHPRLWLFVGDSVNSFETYLLFNSNHGHPHMDNWYLVNWKLSQPPATDMFKLIGYGINCINVHDEEHNTIDSFIMKANYDEWMKYCGRSEGVYDVPDEKYYPILEIDTSIKKIQLGTKWYSCHYPVSIFDII